MTPRPAPGLPLSDGSVTLRASEPRDLPAIDTGIHDPDVVRWIGPPEGSAIDVLDLNRQRWASGSPTLSICDGDGDGECVGLVWLNVSHDDRATGAIGYWLLRGARGRGLATRAVRLMSGWAARDLGVTTFRLVTEAGNEQSQRVAGRSGFRQTGVHRGRTTVDGRSIDELVYELVIESE